ncbi:ATP-binding protein [Aromatoleum toluclasticum]|uniref:ATP-binding protein n=1 Tax=Aromatoleum toluclasticum TaxID=92003 RepID=UPI002B1CC03D|nr:ATP-binding protein [Aromatoleum toluclasticum]
MDARKDSSPGSRRFGQSLRDRLVIFFLVLDLTTLVAMSAGVAYHASGTVADQVQASLEDKLRFSARAIVEDLRTKWEHLRATSRNTLLVNGVVDSLGREAYLRSFIEKLTLAGRGGEHPQIAVLDYKGRLITANHSAGPPAPDTPWLKEVLAGRAQGSVRLDAGGKAWVTLAFPIFYHSQVEGVLAAEFGFDFVGELIPDAGHPVSAIVDAMGRTVYGDTPPAVVEAVGRAGAGPQFVESGGQLHALLALPFPDGEPPFRWHVVLSVPVAHLHEPVAELVWRMAIVGLFSALAVSALVFWRARRFVQPLEALRGTMHAIVDHGDLSSRVPPGGGDEIGQLGESFNNMMGRLQAQDVALSAEIAERRRAEADLRTANDSLRQTLEELRATQAQLVQSEKMASLGQLAAGVAHEINNPVGFVKSNIRTLRSYGEDLLMLLDRYEEACATVATGPAVQQLADLRAQMDIEFMRGDLMQLLDESQEGLVRIAKIVADLKDFSHVDRQELEPADLNVLIDKVINVAWNELKYKAEVIRDYGALPSLYCYPGRLGQVFLNLLVNAAQAIATRGSIGVRTGVEGGEVVVRVSDTGTGIAPEIVGRIFDPFFTTKPVGKGTGLGLHIVYKIVETHNGRIDVDSTPGRGTTFTIRLPIAGLSPAASDVVLASDGA